MKKTRIMLFSLAVMLMGIIMQGCGGITASGVAASINKQCPISTGSGIDVTKSFAEGDNIVMVCNLDTKKLVENMCAQFGLTADKLDQMPPEIYDKINDGLKAQLPTLGAQMKPAMVEGMKAGAAKDENLKTALSLVKTAGCNLVYRITLTSGESSDVVITAEDLK